jgi:hypothetical protein
LEFYYNGQRLKLILFSESNPEGYEYTSFIGQICYKTIEYMVDVALETISKSENKDLKIKIDMSKLNYKGNGIFHFNSKRKTK